MYFKTALRFLSFGGWCDLLLECSFGRNHFLILSFPLFWLQITLTRVFSGQSCWDPSKTVKASIVACSQSGITMNLRVAVKVGQIEITFQSIWSIYRLQVAKITASVMHIYTVFKGTPNDKGSTFKDKINLDIRTYYRESIHNRIIITFKLLTLSPSDLEPCSCRDFWRSSICCCNSRICSLLSLL